MLNENDRRRARALGVQAFCSLLASFAMITYAVHAGMPHNALRLPFERDLATVVLLPEGWAFFTRDAQEPALLLRARSSHGEWRSASLGANAEPSNLFGFSRRPRAQSVEVGTLLAHVAEDDWSSCEVSPDECLDGAPLARTLQNDSPDPLLCGSIGLVRQERLPWAWAKSATVMPSRVVRLEVTCSHS